MAIEDLTTKGELERFILDRSGVDRLEAMLRNRPRIVRGEISPTGTVVLGEGFSAARNAVGDYTVTFDPAFPSTPVVLLSAGSTTAAVTVKIFHGVPVTASSFRVLTFLSNTGASVDAVFEFIAVTA